MATSVDSWADLAQFGIKCLTGEADPYSLRLLCDLNEAGLTHVQEFLGLPTSSPLSPPWNCTVAGAPAVASILLHKSMLQPLAQYLMFHVAQDQYVIFADDGSVRGYSSGDLELLKITEARLLSVYGGKCFRNPNPCGHNRNQHAFTGRTN